MNSLKILFFFLLKILNFLKINKLLKLFFGFFKKLLKLNSFVNYNITKLFKRVNKFDNLFQNVTFLNPFFNFNLVIQKPNKMKSSNINDILTMFFKNCIFAPKKFILKKLNAFSVIELLISLIVISLTLAAFAPAISRKLTTSSVVLNGIISGGNNNNNNTGGNVSMPSELNSQEVCDKLAPNLLFLSASQNGGKAACVTKANVGDTYANGPEITASAGIKIVKANEVCTSSDVDSLKCCWLGNNVDSTVNACNSSVDSSYSGCTRTVCNLNAAKAACENWEPMSGTKGKWRLPTQSEFSAWSTNLSTIQTNKGKNGLDLCDDSSDYGSTQCKYSSSVTPSMCSMYLNRVSRCYPYYIWSSDSSPHSAYSLSLGTFYSIDESTKSAYSARCLIDEDAYKEVFGGNTNNNSGTDNSTSTLPTDITSQSDCDKIGKNLLFLTATQNGGTAACVTKANVGDSYNNGPDLDKIKSSAGITVVNAGTSCGSSSDYSSKCCWLGNNIGGTSGSCSSDENSNSTYSGCYRTVCTWAAAKAACENWESVSGTKGKWRLPTQSELSAWGGNISVIQTNQGKSGLELCDYNSGYGSVQCYYYNGACPGSYNGGCYPYIVWSSDESSSSNAYYHALSSGSFYSNSNYKTYAYSARCVLDANTYKNGTSSGGSSSSLPTSLTSQADCDKLGSNLLFLNASQNGGKRACVTKANVGDSYANGPDLDKIKSSAGITVVKARETCGSKDNYSSKCCWLGNNIGKTASSCGATGNGDSTYSGCKRTVCNWAAAKAACENWEPVSGTKGKWRLPTDNELDAWVSNISTIQKNQGKNGLELCDDFSGYGSVPCYERDSACPGSYNGECSPNRVWSSGEDDSSNAYNHYLNTGNFNSNTYYKTSAFSARCVLDEDSL